jgi:hypothetical protein
LFTIKSEKKFSSKSFYNHGLQLATCPRHCNHFASAIVKARKPQLIQYFLLIVPIPASIYPEFLYTYLGSTLVEHCVHMGWVVWYSSRSCACIYSLKEFRWCSHINYAISIHNKCSIRNQTQSIHKLHQLFHKITTSKSCFPFPCDQGV